VSHCFILKSRYIANKKAETTANAIKRRACTAMDWFINTFTKKYERQTPKNVCVSAHENTAHVETVICQLTERFQIEKVCARDCLHLSNRFIRKILAYTLGMFLNWILGNPILHLICCTAKWLKHWCFLYFGMQREHFLAFDKPLRASARQPLKTAVRLYSAILGLLQTKYSVFLRLIFV